MSFGLVEGKLNSTDLDPWWQPYFIVNKTLILSIFVYSRKSRDRFRILVNTHLHSYTGFQITSDKRLCPKRNIAMYNRNRHIIGCRQLVRYSSDKNAPITTGVLRSQDVQWECYIIVRDVSSRVSHMGLYFDAIFQNFCELCTTSRKTRIY